MGISIAVRAGITLTCKHVYYRECSESITVDGAVTLPEEIEVDSVPSRYDIIESTTYELPEGWIILRGEVICPACAAKERKQQ